MGRSVRGRHAKGHIACGGLAKRCYEERLGGPTESVFDLYGLEAAEIPRTENPLSSHGKKRKCDSPPFARGEAATSLRVELPPSTNQAYRWLLTGAQTGARRLKALQIS